MVKAADLELEFNQFKGDTNARLTTLENELAAMRLEVNQHHEQSNQRHEQSTKLQEEMMRMMTELMKKGSHEEVESTKGFHSYEDNWLETLETSAAGEKRKSRDGANFFGPKKVEFDISSGFNGTNNYRMNEISRNKNSGPDVNDELIQQQTVTGTNFRANDYRSLAKRVSSPTKCKRKCGLAPDTIYNIVTDPNNKRVFKNIQNTVVAVLGGYKMQAVALRIAGDKAVLYRVRILGTQDTILDESGSHYLYQCYIEGSVDFILATLDHSTRLHSVADKYRAIAANHRNSEQEDSRFSFECRRHGADRRNRVSWSKSLGFVEAMLFLDKHFIDGEDWLRL